MKTVGIITEYNPFHNGHLYHIRESKKKARAQAVICVMSGHFLQRGEPALLDKWARAKMALQGGVDLLFELPFAYASRSAEAFAFGAVRLLDATGVVDSLSFGSELGGLAPLLSLAEALVEEPTPYKEALSHYLKEGLSFPKARNLSLVEILPSRKEELAPILKSPNNILGIEYLKALHRLKSSILPFTIQRKGRGYHDKTMEGPYASATAIRGAIERGQEIEELKDSLPPTSLAILKEELKEGRGPIFLEDLAPYLLFLLRQTKKERLEEILGVTEGLENRIKDATKEALTIEELASSIKTRRYTLTRIRRIFIHLLTNYSAREAQAFDLEGGPRYLRILGFNQVGQALLKKMRERAYLPTITKVAPFYHQGFGLTKTMLGMDILATDLYALLYQNPEKRLVGQDFCRGLVLEERG